MLSESERNAAWVRFVLKLRKVLFVLDEMKKLEAVLGEKTYQKLFPKATIELKEEEVMITRVIGDEVMGKQLERSKPDTMIAKQAKADPTLCQHPSEQLKPKSNKKDGKGIDWFVCLGCASRWERMKLTDVEPKSQMFTDKDLVTFGDYLGKTYSDVWRDPVTAQHIIRTAEIEKSASPALKRLALYLIAREKQEGAWFKVPEPTLDTALEEDYL